MKVLDLGLIAEKNRLDPSGVYVLLIEIQIPDDTMLFLAWNNEDIVFNGQEYTAIGMEIEGMGETSKGERGLLTLRISNETRALQYYIEKYDGGVGFKFTIKLVNTNFLESDYTELTQMYDLVSTTATSHWVSFTLGGPDISSARFPLYRYIPSKCRYVSKYKGIECGYPINGPLPTCSGTLVDCDTHLNSTRFGGFVGLSKGNIRLV